MSGVIFGIINFSEDAIPIEISESIRNSLDNYKIDNFKYIRKKNALICCGLQYTTPESVREVLPYEDINNELIITADAIIDNRGELLRKIGLNENKVDDFTDSEYILMAYKKWGADCAKYLLGDFSFTIFDENKNEVICVRDQLGTRPYYYYYDNNIFAFCTVIEPLLKILEKRPELNERWITDFLSLEYGSLTEPEETVYTNIKKLRAAHKLIVSKCRFNQERYWNPLEKIDEIKFSSDKEYIEKFLNIYREAINCRLRCKDEVGLMMSGGLDSSSIAALGAKLLKKQGKILKTFTEVPMNGFDDSLIYKKSVVDESNDVIKLKNYIGNIETFFYSFNESNAFNVIDDYLSILECPYKTVENSQWLNNIYKEAKKNNCTVLLNGWFGNLNISFGDFETYEKTLMCKGNYLKLYKEIKAYEEKSDNTRKELLKGAIRSVLPYKIRKKRFYKKYPDYDILDKSLANKDLMDYWNVRERFDSKELNAPIYNILNLRGVKKRIIDEIKNAEVYEATTKAALKNGIVVRDPCADVRVIEFCLSLPVEQFFGDGVGRLLIRNAMNGLLPESIRMNVKTRGLQGADWIQRLKPAWNELCIEINNSLNDINMSKYLNIDKVRKLLDSTEKGIDENKKEDVRFLIITLILSKFINKYLIKEGDD